MGGGGSCEEKNGTRTQQQHLVGGPGVMISMDENLMTS